MLDVLTLLAGTATAAAAAAATATAITALVTTPSTLTTKRLKTVFLRKENISTHCYKEQMERGGEKVEREMHNDEGHA